VPTLDGDPVTVKVPAGTQPGQVLRVRGRGVPAAERRPAGDLLVSLQVTVPRHLSHKQRKAFESLVPRPETLAS
jgi:DnaJ-class molecular chaperone